MWLFYDQILIYFKLLYNLYLWYSACIGATTVIYVYTAKFFTESFLGR